MAKAMEKFRLQIARDQYGPTVKIAGELDAYTAPRVRKASELLIDGSASQLVFDLTEMTFVDSTGLGVLVGAARRAREREMEVVLDRPSPSVFRVLELTGVSSIIPVRNKPTVTKERQPALHRWST